MPYDARADHLLAYFEIEVLAPYQTQPDKYKVQTDYFEGQVETTSAYYLELEQSGRTKESVSVRFGYRAKADGQLAIVIWARDLVIKSAFHVERWNGFQLDRHAVAWMDYDEDARFSLWVRRHLGGDWSVDNGPGTALVSRIALMNGLSLEVASVRLFDVPDEAEQHVMYPIAENSHRYADAHRELYGLLIDTLDRKAIQTLGARMGTPVNCASDRSLACLRKVFPELSAPAFSSPLAHVSEQRRLAAHKRRPAAKAMKAFEAFTGDLNRCVGALDVLTRTLEERFGIDAEQSHSRQEALRHLPPIATRKLPTTCSIHGARAMTGKTVERVEVGDREQYANSHGSEVIHIHFTDGSIMALDTGSNAWNLATDTRWAELKPQEFHVDFMVHWVPPSPARG